MIWIAIAIEAIIKDWPDFFVLLTLQILNSTVGWFEDWKAGNAVAALKNALKPECQVIRNGVHKKMEATLLVPGDIVTLAAGAAVPADCEICDGKPVQVDQAALTGESLPVTLAKGDSAKMGSNVTRGEIEAIVTATGSQTFFGKTAAMIASVDEVGHFQKVILQITFGLLCVSFVMTGIVLGYLLLNGEDVLQAIAFAVVLLIASIPIAMQVVCTSTMALGCRMLAEEKAIVSRLTSIEELASMNMLCSDKTGTLTMNKMELQDDLPMWTAGVTRLDVLEAACLAAKWREPAKDAIDTLVLKSIPLKPLDRFEQIEYEPFDPSTKFTEATLKDDKGYVFKVMKGAPQVVLSMVHNRQQIGESVDAKIMELASRGIRGLAVARTNAKEQWELLGILTFLDPPRQDTRATIEKAYEYGIDVKMITGDQQTIAIETCRVLGMGMQVLTPENLPAGDNLKDKNLGKNYGALVENADGFAQVYPDHKFTIIEILRQKNYVVGMTGDGVNDAPALKRADVGVAVEGATDAAQAAADIVLTAPGLSTIVTAILYAREIFQRMKNYVIYRIACTLQLLSFFFFAILAIHPNAFGFEDHLYFKLPVIALVVITILNDGCIISIAYDHVRPSHTPEKWHFVEIFTVATIIGGVAVVSSLLLLYLGLKTHEPDSILKKFGLSELDYGQVCTMIYLKVSLSDFLTVFAARTIGPFFSRFPGWQLAIAACVAMGASTVLSHEWDHILDIPEMKSLHWKWIGFVWVYCLVWFIIQDVIKVITYWLLYKMNIGSEAHHQGLMAQKSKMVMKRENRRALTHESVMKGESLFKASVRVTGKSTALQLEQDDAGKYKSMTQKEILSELNTLDSKIKALKDALK
jgi:H+-transporting ATPase